MSLCRGEFFDRKEAKRIGLTYVDEKSDKKNPIIIHRAILGSYERFVSFLLEQTNGALPLWLSPIQVRVLSISEDNMKYAKSVERELSDNGIRVDGNYEPSTIEYKIRDAQLQKIPYMIVIGNKEEQGKNIAVRSRDGKVKYNVKLDEFLKQLSKENKIT